MIQDIGPTNTMTKRLMRREGFWFTAGVRY